MHLTPSSEFKLFLPEVVEPLEYIIIIIIIVTILMVV